MTPDHLQVETSDRSLNYLPPIPGGYGGMVRVYESSAGPGPHIWLDVAAVKLHLTAADAWKLAQQIQHLVRHHYQGGPLRAADLPAGSVVVDDLRGLAWYANADPGEVDRWDETGAKGCVQDSAIDWALQHGATVWRIGVDDQPPPVEASHG